ncbi:MAG: 50S ribosomal protein L25, partial [Planctomycetaceae bacterium]|nr:50S ribosomal protein L25 [Planctomycetaceae bacterium]
MSALGTIAIDVREAKGSTACRRLRRAGLVPANVYGHGEDPVM